MELRVTPVVVLLALIACDAGRRGGGPMNPSTQRDAEISDAGEPDAAPPADGGEGRDAIAPDATSADAAALDAMPLDAISFDAAEMDAAPRDADPPDLGFRDADPVDVGFPPDLGPADLGIWPDAMVRDAGMIQDAGTPACSNDTQCASGRCHPLYGQCVPPGQLPQCANCAADSQCGMPSDHCLDISIGGTYLETICGQACRTSADCQRGYACTVDNHCYPISGAIRAHTCWSLADMLAGENCDSLGMVDTCGAPNYDDGTCVPTLGCTVGCNTNNDCPDNSTCTSFFVSDYCVAN